MSILSPVSISEKIYDQKVEEQFRRWRDVINVLIEYVHIGSGTPESVETGSVGHIFLRTDGGASTSIYIKESGTDTNTGWVAK